jgi:hypothetical protein
MSNNQNPEKLREFLEDIASELQPVFSGELEVKRFVPRGYTPGVHACQYVEEVVPSKLLGFIPWSKRREVLRINEPFYGAAYGVKEISGCLVDGRAEQVLMEHLGEYAPEHGATDVEIQRGLSEPALTPAGLIAASERRSRDPTVIRLNFV